MTVPVADERILQRTSATVRVVLTDQDGLPADAGSAVTVGVARWDGTEVLPAGTATSHGTVGEYTVPLTSAQTATLDLLTATWTVGGETVDVTTVAVVGGYWFSIAEARRQPGLEDSGKVTTATLVAKRREVEEEAERIIGAAFVPRFRVVSLWGDGSDRLQVPDRLLRGAPRGVSFASVALSDAALANVVAGGDGTFTRYWPTLPGPQDDSWSSSWGERFPSGTRVTAAYEHGLDRPPADLKRAALRRLRSIVNADVSGIPDRAVTFTAAEGGTFSLATPGTRDWHTGIPDVDDVYAAYRVMYGGRQRAGSVPIG